MKERQLTETEYLIKAHWRTMMKALGGTEAASAAIGGLVSSQTLHSYGSITQPDSFPRADVIMRVEAAYGVFKLVSQVLHGSYVERPPVDIDHTSPLEMGARAGEVLGEFHKTAREAAQDGELDAGERRALLKRSRALLIEAHSINDELERYDAACRSGLRAVGE